MPGATFGHVHVGVLCLSPFKGGMELDSLRMYDRLSKRFKCSFLCAEDTFIAQNFLRSTRDKQALVLLRFWPFAALKLVSVSLAVSLRRAIAERKITHLIFFGTSEMRSIAIASLGLNLKIFLRHVTTVSNSKKGWLRGFGYRRVDTYLPISQHLAKNLYDFFPIRRESSVQVLYPAFDPPTVNLAQRSRADGLRIIYHSRFVEGKGQLDALRAFQHLHSVMPTARLTLVGDFFDDAYVEKIKSFAAAQGLTSYCTIANFTTNVFSYLSEADIFLCPSYGEGFCNSLVEALSFGLICVTYDNTVFPECRDLGFYFLMTETGNVESFADGLMNAAVHCARHRLASEKNVRLASEVFSSARELEIFEKLVND